MINEIKATTELLTNYFRFGHIFFQKTLFSVQLIVYIWLKMKYLYVNVIVEEIWRNQVPMKWKCSDIIYLLFLLLNHLAFLLKPS